MKVKATLLAALATMVLVPAPAGASAPEREVSGSFSSFFVSVCDLGEVLSQAVAALTGDSADDTAGSPPAEDTASAPGEPGQEIPSPDEGNQLGPEMDPLG